MMPFSSYIAKAREIKDPQGTPVDEGILELVAALHMHGFRTGGSCEGHMEHEGYSYPFVTLVTPEPEGYDYAKFCEDENHHPDLHEEWLHANLEQQEILTRLLQDFYKTHKPKSLRCLLVLNSFGPGICNLRSFGAELMMMNGMYEQELPMFQAEIQAFKNFLVERTPS